MDTFMDQLAEKKNADKMIRANTNADFGEIAGKIESLGGDLKEGYHRECVKVYRNVQAAFTEESEKQTALLTKEIELIKEKTRLTMIFSILAFATGLAGLVLQLLSVMKVLP